MDFNIYLTIKPEEWEVTSNNQIIIKKRLPSKLNLHNYKVALIDFASNFKNEYLINISVSKFLKGLTFSIIKPINVPFSTTEDATVIEKRINTYIKAYFCYLLENCYYSYEKLEVPSSNNVYIIKNKNSINNVVVISNTLKKNENFMLLVPTVAGGTHFIVSNDPLGKLETSLAKDSKITVETLITQLDSKDFVQTQFEKYSESQVNYLAGQYDSLYNQLGIINDIKINFSPYKDYYGLTLKQNHDTLKISLFNTLLKTDQEVKIYKDNYNLILIESGMVPFQYFNSSLKRLLKVINYEKDSKSNIYYNIENPYLTTINITLSSLNDNISIEKIIKDYIYINLHFKQ